MNGDKDELPGPTASSIASHMVFLDTHYVVGHGQVEEAGTLVTRSGYIAVNADAIHGTAVRNQ